MSRTTKMNE